MHLSLLACAATVGIGLFLAAPVYAAEVAMGDKPGCDVSLRGDIETGDFDRVTEAIERSRNNPKQPQSRLERTLCLHSPRGGSYGEALRVIEWLMSSVGHITTVVDERDECVSACALIFMFGHEDLGDAMILPSRRIHASARLGFHSPHIAVAIDSGRPELVTVAYRAGVRAIGRLMEIDHPNLFPKSLLIEMLKREPHEFLFVETVEEAAKWNIGLDGTRPAGKLTRAMLQEACFNEQRRLGWYDTSGSDEGAAALGRPATLVRGHHRAKFEGFGAEASMTCVVDVYDLGKGPQIEVMFIDDEDDPRLSPPKNPKSKDFSLLPVPGWYVFPKDTRIEVLAEKQN